MATRHGSGSSYVYRKGSPPAADTGLKPETMGVREERDNKLAEIRAALEASPDKIVLIVSRDHWGNKEGEWHADKIKLQNGERGWAHAAVAFLDKDGNVVLVEKTPGSRLGPIPVVVLSPNKSGTATDLVTGYKEIEVIPLDFSRFGAGARERFLTAFLQAVARPYSGLAIFGDHCSGAFQKGLQAAADQSKMTPVERAMFLEFMKLFRFTFTLNTFTPNDAYLAGKKLGVSFHFDPFKGDGKYSNPDQITASAGVADHTESRAAILAAAAAATLETRASPTRAADEDQKSSPQDREAPSDDDDDDGDENALTSDTPRDPETNQDDEDDLEEGGLEHELRLASASREARSGDAPQAPDIDDDDDAEDVLTDDRAQQLAIDDDDEEQDDDEDELEDASDDEDELEDASDAEDAPAADAPVMQTAKAEAGADATADDQAGPRLATSAPVTADDGFSFSQFPKPGVPTEVATEVLPAEQASPVEQSSGSGLPGSESADPGLDGSNVGNAAPSPERVVHHGDLAP